MFEWMLEGRHTEVEQKTENAGKVRRLSAREC